MNTHKIAISKYLILTVAFAFFCLSSYIVLAHGSDYRSDVANVAGKLKEVAGKDKNIGEEISQIAKEQEEAVEEVESAKEAVEEKGQFRVFLIGTDYKNIGVLRGKVVTTQNHLERLVKALDRTTDPEVQAELEKQILELQDIKFEVETFIKDHESQFSILGWFVRLFNR
ncbi:MAG TPA: hypothetical protein VJ046_01940 [Candidatus Paceibacterota bacterium]|nr:hypothetical protein [Candidatus Paceibacterota bacterium]